MGVDGCGCRALSFQAAAEEIVVFTLCRCVVDYVCIDVWELIFHLLPRVFGVFVKGDVYWVDVAGCVESLVGSVSVCIGDES